MRDVLTVQPRSRIMPCRRLRKKALLDSKPPPPLRNYIILTTVRSRIDIFDSSTVCSVDLYDINRAVRSRQRSNDPDRCLWYLTKWLKSIRGTNKRVLLQTVSKNSRRRELSVLCEMTSWWKTPPPPSELFWSVPRHSK
jgi:hypothetical protein